MENKTNKEEINKIMRKMMSLAEEVIREDEWLLKELSKK